MVVPDQCFLGSRFGQHYFYLVTFGPKLKTYQRKKQKDKMLGITFLLTDSQKSDAAVHRSQLTLYCQITNDPQMLLSSHSDTSRFTANLRDDTQARKPSVLSIDTSFHAHSPTIRAERMRSIGIK